MESILSSLHSIRPLRSQLKHSKLNQLIFKIISYSFLSQRAGEVLQWNGGPRNLADVLFLKGYWSQQERRHLYVGKLDRARCLR